MLKLLSQEVMSMVVIAGVILFGAIVHATAQLKIARDKEREFTLADFAILMVIASFAGLVFGLVATIFFEDSQIIIILFSAIGAFLGMAGLNKISNILLDFLVSRVDKK